MHIACASFANTEEWSKMLCWHFVLWCRRLQYSHTMLLCIAYMRLWWKMWSMMHSRPRFAIFEAHFALPPLRWGLPWSIVLAVSETVHRWASPMSGSESVAECSLGGDCACWDCHAMFEFVADVSVSDCVARDEPSDDIVLGIPSSKSVKGSAVALRMWYGPDFGCSSFEYRSVTSLWWMLKLTVGAQR